MNIYFVVSCPTLPSSVLCYSKYLSNRQKHHRPTHLDTVRVVLDLQPRTISKVTVNTDTSDIATNNKRICHWNTSLLRQVTIFLSNYQNQKI